MLAAQPQVDGEGLLVEQEPAADELHLVARLARIPVACVAGVVVVELLARLGIAGDLAHGQLRLGGSRHAHQHGCA